MLPWLLVMLSISISLYDLRTKRIPNWVTLPLMVAGLIAHFPGTVELLLMCMALWLAWTMGWMGGGDAKLWMALLWMIPSEWTQEGIVAMLTILLITGLIQLLWRSVRKKPGIGIQNPGAWRTIPFAIWLVLWHAH